MLATSGACATGCRARTGRCRTGCRSPSWIRTPSRTSAPAAPRRPARRRASARRSAGCRASSATPAAIAGAAGGHRSRPATSCGSPATRSGSPGAGWRDGSTRARGPRRHRSSTRSCGTARTWTRSIAGRRNEPIGVYAQAGGQTRPIGSIDFTPEPTVSEIEVFLTGERGRADRRLPPLPRAGQRHGRAIRQSARDRGRHAGLRRPVDRDRRPVPRRPRRRGGLRAALRSAAAGALRASADGRTAGDRPEPIGRPGARRRAARPRARRRARGPLRSPDPRPLGRMPSGCCDRS